MSALLGMQDRNSIRLQVISLGNIFQPLVFVVTLWTNSKGLGEMFIEQKTLIYTQHFREVIFL